MMQSTRQADLQRYCFVIPHFNHSVQFGQFLKQLTDSGISCIVVDDGSEDLHKSAVKAITSNIENVHFFEHSWNRGKGAAVFSACVHARNLGFSHVIQIDADGQHDPMDAWRLIEASKLEPTGLISGNPRFDESAPKARLYGRKVSTFFVAIETVSVSIKDALCGFRVYPLDTMEYLLDRYHIGPGMDFDTDIIVKCSWAGFPIAFVETNVRYNSDGISHFHYLRDNVRLIKLHCRLLLQTCFYIPLKIARKFK